MYNRTLSVVIMQESCLFYITCPKCARTLELEVLDTSLEIEEGFLHCRYCNYSYPIISGIPILLDDFVNYISKRQILGGELFQSSKNIKIRTFLKKSLLCAKKLHITQSNEQHWVDVYQNSVRSRFYSTIRRVLDKIPKTHLALEYGCSIGTISTYLAKKHETVIGIDHSFYALQIARKNALPNIHYLVGDILNNPFGDLKFPIILGLNILDIVEPKMFVDMVSKQIQTGTLLLSDPYDFKRGINSVNDIVDAYTLRKILRANKFKITFTTVKPSMIPWILKINSRIELKYFNDLILCKKL